MSAESRRDWTGEREATKQRRDEHATAHPRAKQLEQRALSELNDGHVAEAIALALLAQSARLESLGAASRARG
jgi:hypothetical protein